MKRRLSAKKPTPIPADVPLGSRKFVYVGPTIPGLQNRAILGKATPRYVEDMIAKCPTLARLIVPLDLMSTSIKAVARRGSQMEKNARVVQNHFNRR